MTTSKIHLFVATFFDHFGKENEASNPAKRESKVSLKQGLVAQVAKVNCLQLGLFLS